MINNEVLIGEENLTDIRPIYDYKKDKNRPLVFAILGLLTGVFMGFGIIFSILSLIMQKHYLFDKGTTFKWARNLSIIGFVLNLAFILALVGYLIYSRFFIVVNEIIF